MQIILKYWLVICLMAFTHVNKSLSHTVTGRLFFSFTLSIKQNYEKMVIMQFSIQCI